MFIGAQDNVNINLWLSTSENKFVIQKNAIYIYITLIFGSSKISSNTKIYLSSDYKLQRIIMSTVL